MKFKSLLLSGMVISVLSVNAEPTAAPVAGSVSSKPGTVVIQVNGAKITIGDLEKLKASAPTPQIQGAPLDKVFKPLRDQKVVELLIEQAKAKQDLSNDPEVKKMVEEAKKAIQLQVFMKREVEKRSTDDKLRVLYNDLMKKFKNQKEFEVGLIVVANEQDSNKVLNALNSGQPFEQVAMQYSIEPNTKKQGGRLGYLVEGAISEVLGPDVGKSLKVLKDNVHSKKAVKMKDGKYIIVRRGSSRAATAPNFEDIKEQLKNMYAQQAIMDYIEELRKASNVQVFTMEGQPDTFQLLAKKK